VQKEQQDQQAQQVQKGQMVKQVRAAPMERWVQLATQDRLVRMADPGKQDLEVIVDKMEEKAAKVQQAQEVKMERLALLAGLVRPELLVKAELLVVLVFKDRLEKMERQDQEDLQVHLVNQENLVKTPFIVHVRDAPKRNIERCRNYIKHAKCSVLHTCFGCNF